MAAISSLTDEEVDELLAGHAPEGRWELTPLAEVTTALRARKADEPVPVMRYALRHAVIRSAVPAAPPRSRRLVHTALAGAAIGVLGLAGAANALPAPMQDAVAEVGDLVGIEVPHASDERPAEAPEGVGGPARSAGPEADDGLADAPPDGTPSGTTPADPGTAGDLEPARPATPPEPAVGDDEHQVAPNASAVDGVENRSPDAAERSGNADGAPGPAEPSDDGDGDEEGDEAEPAPEAVDGREDREVPTSGGSGG